MDLTLKKRFFLHLIQMSLSQKLDHEALGTAILIIMSLDITKTSKELQEKDRLQPENMLLFLTQKMSLNKQSSRNDTHSFMKPNVLLLTCL